MMLPILYSYRRCPFAMRARIALKLANIPVEIREISLRDKPAHMLQVSPKGTVPVMVLVDGRVIDESLAIMAYALNEHAMHTTQYQTSDHARCMALVLENDTSFKDALDHYKYPERAHQYNQQQFQLAYRQQGEAFLQQLDNLLKQNTYLFTATPNYADYAIFPFVRQFSAVDKTWFESTNYPKLRTWLKNLVESDLFKSVMEKQPTYIE